MTEKPKEQLPSGSQDRIREEAVQKRAEILGMTLGQWYELNRETKILLKKDRVDFAERGDRIRLIDHTPKTIGEESYYRAQVKRFDSLRGSWQVEEALVKLPLEFKPLEKKGKNLREQQEAYRQEVTLEIDSAADAYAKALEAKDADLTFRILNNVMERLSPEKYPSSVRAGYPISMPEILRRIKNQAKKRRRKEPLGIKEYKKERPVQLLPEKPKKKKVIEVKTEKPTIGVKPPEEPRVTKPEQEKKEEPPKPTITLPGEDAIKKALEAAAGGRATSSITEDLAKIDTEKLRKMIAVQENTLSLEQKKVREIFLAFEDRADVQDDVTEQQWESIRAKLTVATVQYMRTDEQLKTLIGRALLLLPPRPKFHEIQPVMSDIKQFAEKKFKTYFTAKEGWLQEKLRMDAFRNAWSRFIIEKTSGM